MLRLLLAGFGVWVAVFATLALIGFETPLVLLMGPVMFGAAVVLTALLNKGAVFGPRKSIEEQVAELEAQGMLVDTAFRATRAFQVEEVEDEGSTYFLDIGEGRVSTDSISTNTNPTRNSPGDSHVPSSWYADIESTTGSPTSFVEGNRSSRRSSRARTRRRSSIATSFRAMERSSANPTRR